MSDVKQKIKVADVIKLFISTRTFDRTRASDSSLIGVMLVKVERRGRGKCCVGGNMEAAAGGRGVGGVPCGLGVDRSGVYVM